MGQTSEFAASSLALFIDGPTGCYPHTNIKALNFRIGDFSYKSPLSVTPESPPEHIFINALATNSYITSEFIGHFDTENFTQKGPTKLPGLFMT